MTGKALCIAGVCIIRDRVWVFLSIKFAVTATVNYPFYVCQCKILLAYQGQFNLDLQPTDLIWSQDFWPLSRNARLRTQSCLLRSPKGTWWKGDKMRWEEKLFVNAFGFYILFNIKQINAIIHIQYILYIFICSLCIIAFPCETVACSETSISAEWSKKKSSWLQSRSV